MNYLETLKNIAKDKKKRTENIVFLIILLVTLLVSINYIFSDKKIENKNSTISDTNINSNEKTNNSLDNGMEKKLEIILSQISGISDVSVVLTYSKDSKKNIVYNTKETESAEEKTSEKTVAYNEANGDKTAIVESIELPSIEGAIVVAKGANNVDVRSKIANAIANVLNIPVYKVQVFEKEG